jgi:hypothetical protein
VVIGLELGLELGVDITVSPKGHAAVEDNCNSVDDAPGCH